MRIFVYKIIEDNDKEQFEILIGNGEQQDSLFFQLMPDVTKGIELLLGSGFSVLGIQFRRPWDFELRKVQGRTIIFNCQDLSETEIEGIKSSVISKIKKGIGPQY